MADQNFVLKVTKRQKADLDFKFKTVKKEQEAKGLGFLGEGL